MKKKKNTGRRKGEKLSRSNRAKLRRSKKSEIILSSPGPSPYITKNKDGKVVIKNITGNVKQKDYTTKIGKESRQANKTARQEKKNRIKEILASLNFDPTVKYTRKEKKRFTRAVKKYLFKDSSSVVSTKDESKLRKFRYVVQNQSEDNPNKDTDFLTDYIDVKDDNEALIRVKQIAQKYKDNEKFTGIRLEDPETENSIYLPKIELLKAA